MKRQIDVRVDQFKQEMRRWQDPAALKKLLEDARSIFGESVITGTDFKFWREGSNGADFGQLIGANGIRLVHTDPPDLELRIETRILQIEVGEALTPGRRRHDEYRQRERIDAALENAAPLDPADRQMAANWALPAPRSLAEKTALCHLKIAQELKEDERRTIAKLIEDHPEYLTMRNTPFLQSDEERKKAVHKSLEVLAENKSSKDYDRNISLLIYLNSDTEFLPVEEIEAIFPKATLAAKISFSEVWILWDGSAYQIWCDGEQGTRTLRPPEQD
jgi:hypothetical protein